MEQVITISLNGYPYKLTAEAYNLLRDYLDALINRFGQSNEAKETYDAIEARIGELISERQGDGGSPVAPETIAEIIGILGKPEDIDEEQERQEARNAKADAEETSEKERNRMRLYRDPDNAMIGGVCAGIAARLGVNANIVRLLFLIGFLFFGASIFVYIALWVAVPVARTPLQKLRMKGKPITLDSIRNETYQNYKNFRRAGNAGKQAQPQDSLKQFGNLLAFFAVSLSRIALKLIAIIFIAVGALGASAITAFLIAALSSDLTFLDKFFDDTALSALSLLGWSAAPRAIAVAVWGVVFVPLASFAVAGVRLLTNSRIPKIISACALVFWILCIITLVFLTPITSWKVNSHLSHSDEEYAIPMRPNDTLAIDLRGSTNWEKNVLLNPFSTPTISIQSTDEDVPSIRTRYDIVTLDQTNAESYEGLYKPFIDTARVRISTTRPKLTGDPRTVFLNVRSIIYLPEGCCVKLTPAAAKKASALSEQKTLRGSRLAKGAWQMRDGYLYPIGGETEQSTDEQLLQDETQEDPS